MADTLVTESIRPVHGVPLRVHSIGTRSSSTPPRSPAGLTRLLGASAAALSAEALDGTITKRDRTAAAATQASSTCAVDTNLPVSPLPLAALSLETDSGGSPTGPLGRRPNLVRLGSGSRTITRLHLNASPSLSAATGRSSPSSIGSPQQSQLQPELLSPPSCPELQPIRLPRPAESAGHLHTAFQAELTTQRKERIRQQLLRAGLHSPPPHREEEHIAAGSLQWAASAAAVEDAVDESFTNIVDVSTPLPPRPDFSRAQTEPARHRRRRTYSNTSFASGNHSALVPHPPLDYTSEAASVAAQASVDADIAAKEQREAAQHALQKEVLLPQPADTTHALVVPPAQNDETLGELTSEPITFRRHAHSVSSSSNSSRRNSQLLVVGLPPSSTPSGSRQGSRQPSPVRSDEARVIGAGEATLALPLPATPLSGRSSRASHTPSPQPPAAKTVDAVVPTPTVTPPRKKHVIFREQLCDCVEFSSRSTSARPQHSRTNSLSTAAATPAQQIQSPQSVLKRPSTLHASKRMDHVVQQIAPGLSRAHAPTSNTHAFSLNSPYASPAALLRLQVALFHDGLHLDAYCTRVTRAGAVLIKYNQSGKPMPRWFWVQETADEVKLCWCEPKHSKHKTDGELNPNGLDEEDIAADERRCDGERRISLSKSKPHGHTLPSAFHLPAFSIGRWKFNPDRSRNLLDVCGLSYGPYTSPLFARFLDKLDSASGKPWLCFTVQFRDRTIDIVCANEFEVTAWFLGLQAQATMSAYHMSRGMILWQRLIMKLNYYGLDQIKRVFAKRALMAAQTPQANAH